MDKLQMKSNSLLSNFSLNSTSAALVNFFEMKQKVVANSNQILQNLGIDDFSFEVINNLSSIEEAKLVETIVYSTIYLFQERLRSDSQIICLAPIDYSQFFKLMHRINSYINSYVEVLIPCMYNQFWFMFKYKLSPNNVQLYYFLYMKKDATESSDNFMLEQVQIEKLLTAKYKNLQIGMKDFLRIKAKFKRKEFLIVLETLFSKSTNVYDQEKIVLACNLVISACQTNFSNLEDVGFKIDEILKQPNVNDIKQPIRANSEIMRENDEEAEGICILCITWPFFKNKGKQ